MVTLIALLVVVWGALDIVLGLGMIVVGILYLIASLIRSIPA